jgi:hypothetical protein
MIGGAIFLGLMVLGTAAQHPWVFIPLVLLAGAGGALFWKYKTAKDREELELREQYRRDVIADRADYEDKLYYEGTHVSAESSTAPGRAVPGLLSLKRQRHPGSMPARGRDRLADPRTAAPWPRRPVDLVLPFRRPAIRTRIQAGGGLSMFGGAL